MLTWGICSFLSVVSLCCFDAVTNSAWCFCCLRHINCQVCESPRTVCVGRKEEVGWVCRLRGKESKLLHISFLDHRGESAAQPTCYQNMWLSFALINFLWSCCQSTINQPSRCYFVLTWKLSSTLLKPFLTLSITFWPQAFRCFSVL